MLHAFNIDCIAFKYRPDTKELMGINHSVECIGYGGMLH